MLDMRQGRACIQGGAILTQVGLGYTRQTRDAICKVTVDVGRNEEERVSSDGLPTDARIHQAALQLSNVLLGVT